MWEIVESKGVGRRGRGRGASEVTRDVMHRIPSRIYIQPSLNRCKKPPKVLFLSEMGSPERLDQTTYTGAAQGAAHLCRPFNHSTGAPVQPSLELFKRSINPTFATHALSSKNHIKKKQFHF